MTTIATATIHDMIYAARVVAVQALRHGPANPGGLTRSAAIAAAMVAATTMGSLADFVAQQEWDRAGVADADAYHSTMFDLSARSIRSGAIYMGETFGVLVAAIQGITGQSRDDVRSAIIAALPANSQYRDADVMPAAVDYVERLCGEVR